MYKTKMRQWSYFWEDQHPLARSNVAMLALSLAIWIILVIATYIAPRILTFKQVFQVALVEQLWSITSLVLVAIMIFNAIRTLDRWRKKQVAPSSVVLAVIAVACVLVITLNLPSFVEGTVSYVMGEPYGKVFDNFQSLCDNWENTYGQEATIAVNPSTEDLGMFEDVKKVRVTRDRHVVFFDFGDQIQRFGLACALGGTEPHTDGMADDFHYHRIRKYYYEFVERKNEDQ
jgi:hypothetical protein